MVNSFYYITFCALKLAIKHSSVSENGRIYLILIIEPSKTSE